MKSLFLKEINAFFGSLLGYLIVAMFLVAMGLIVWVFPETSVLDYGYADLETSRDIGDKRDQPGVFPHGKGQKPG